MSEETLIEKHSKWYSENAKYHFEQGLIHGIKHGKNGKFTKEQIEKAISESYEHNSFNSTYFWSNLEKDVQKN